MERVNTFTILTEGLDLSRDTTGFLCLPSGYICGNGCTAGNLCF